MVAAAGILGADATPALLRKLDTFLLDGQRILIAVDEYGRPNSSLLLIQNSFTSEILVLGESPDDRDQSPSIRSTQDLRSLLSAPMQTGVETFSGLTGCWPSCIMELLQLEMVRFQLYRLSSH